MMLAPDPAEDADLTGYVGRGSLLDLLRSRTLDLRFSSLRPVVLPRLLYI